MTIYAKIIGANPYGSYPYRVGLNTLAHNGETFDARPECAPGGLYFCELKNILEWIDYGNTLCIVEPVGQIVKVDNKFKTDRLEIVEMMDLREVETWEYLVNHTTGAYLNYETMRWAVKRGHLDIVKFLVNIVSPKIVKFTDDENQRFCRYALQLAAREGHLEVVKFLVGRGANISVNDGAAVLWAASFGHLDIVKFLVNHGAVFDMDYVFRRSAETGQLEVIKYFVKLGADIHAADDYALRFAVLGGHFELVKYLTDLGADVQKVDNDRLQEAANRGHYVVVHLIEALIGRQ